MTPGQRCGTVTIFYGSSSGSDFWKVLVPVPNFESNDYGSGSYFWKDTVPVPAPYLDHKSKFFKKNWNFFAFKHSKLFYKEKVYKFQQKFYKMWMKIMLNAVLRIRDVMFIPDPGSWFLPIPNPGSRIPDTKTEKNLLYFFL